MAKEIIKILGQVTDATTEKVLYQCPDKRRAIVKVTGFNDAAGNSLIKIAVVNDGGAATPPATVKKDYLLGGITNGYTVGSATPIDVGIDTLKGITLNEFDQIRVIDNTGDVTYHAYGVETEP